MLDYDDLLLYWAQRMSDPDLAAHIRERFDHVPVDEYQDTNHLLCPSEFWANSLDLMALPTVRFVRCRVRGRTG